MIVGAGWQAMACGRVFCGCLRYVFLLLVVASCSLSVVGECGAVALVAREPLEGRLTGDNGFGWKYGFDIALNEGMPQVLVSVAM